MSTPAEKAVEAARDADAQTRQAMALRLGATQEEGLALALVDWLVHESDPFVLETLTWAVVARREETTPLLVEALRQIGAPAERVLHALSKIEDPATVPAVVSFVHHEDEAVAAKAWWALSRIGDDQAMARVLDQLGVSGTQREALTRALVQWGPAALPGLVAALDHEDELVRAHAVEAILRVADPDARGTRGRHGGDPDPRLEDALAAVRDQPGDSVDATLRELTEDRRPGVADLATRLLAERAQK